MEDYEKKYKQLHKFITDLYPHMSEYCKEKVEGFFPELAENKDERIRKAILDLVKQSSHILNPMNQKSMIAWLKKQGEPIDKGEMSDGYHTFNELYHYRMLYNAAFFNMLPKEWVHKSKKHHDGEECFGGGWFIVMAQLPTGQVSNHYELKDWDLFQIPEKETADEWDGHTPQEAADRLHKYLIETQGERKPILDFKAKDWYVSKVDGKIHNIYHSVDKLEPKFKVKKGEWYVCTDTFVSRGKIIAIKGQTYQSLQEDDTITCEDNCLFIDRHDGKASDYFRPWTIEDAKPGDVLFARSTASSDIFILFYNIDENNNAKYYCAYDSKDGFIKGKKYRFNSRVTDCKPATKEQCNLFFQKMEEAGYEWDSEKKELKKIEQKMINEHNEHEPTSYEVEKWNEAYEKGYEIGYMNGKIEQKSAKWSKQQVVNALTNWLSEEIAPLNKKSLDGTITERDEMFRAALLEMRSFVNSSDFQIGKDTSVEWSEEDEKMFDSIIDCLDGLCFIDSDQLKWLKSIKQRIKGE